MRDGVEEALTTAIIEGDDLRLQALLDQVGRRSTSSSGQRSCCSVQQAGEEDEAEKELWPLLAAVKCRKPAVVEALVERLRVRSRRNAQGRSELHALAESQRSPFPPLPARLTANGSKWDQSVRQLLKRLSAPDPVEVGMWRMLMRAGALPYQGDEFGATPFHIACSRGNWPVVHHLLQSLGDQKGEPVLNQRDQNGETALHWAARSGRRDVVALLLAQPAIDAAAEGANGPAAQVAREGGHESIAQMIDVRAFSVSPLLEMPWDALLHVLSFLEPFHLCTVAQVCSIMAEVSSDDALWRRFCADNSGDHTAQAVPAPDERRQRVWKPRYLGWLRPNLHQYARSQQRYSAMVASDQTLRVVIAGDQMVGKTHLFALFLNGQTPAYYEPTVGVGFGSKMITVPGRGQPVRLQIWDAWGQERYRTTTYAYFRGGGTFVLVYNVENAQSLANIRDAWGPQVRCHSHPQAPVIIVVGIENAAGRRRARAVTGAEASAVAQELGAIACVEVSLGSEGAAAEAECVFTRLASAALGLCDPFEQLRDAEPLSWHVPSAELCLRLFAQSNTGREAAKLNSSQSVASGGFCLLQ